MVDVKKLLRSLLVLAPGLQDPRFRAEAWLIRTLRRPYRPEFAGLRALPLPQDPLILDIGCNRGIAAATMLAMRPDARVIGFEANALLAADTARVFAAEPRLEVRPHGLSDRDGTLVIHVPTYRRYRFDGLGSVDRSFAERVAVDGWLYGFDRRRLRVDAVTATVKRLDDLGLAPAVIKIYIQGHEKEALEGAAATLREHEPVILAPSSHDNIEPYLASLGYRRFQWTAQGFVTGVEGCLFDYFMTPARYDELRRRA